MQKAGLRIRAVHSAGKEVEGLPRATGLGMRAGAGYDRAAQQGKRGGLFAYHALLATAPMTTKHTAKRAIEDGSGTGM
jgi:hypothetical protein